MHYRTKPRLLERSAPRPPHPPCQARKYAAQRAASQTEKYMSASRVCNAPVYTGKRSDNGCEWVGASPCAIQPNSLEAHSSAKALKRRAARKSSDMVRSLPLVVGKSVHPDTLLLKYLSRRVQVRVHQQGPTATTRQNYEKRTSANTERKSASAKLSDSRANEASWRVWVISLYTSYPFLDELFLLR